MMISPKTYYELYLKDKSEKEVLTVIKKLQREIKKLKDVMEKPNYSPTMKPDESTQLWCTRLYLEQAKQTLQSIGGTYIPSKEELKVKLFNENIPSINLIEYYSVNVTDGITIKNVSFDEKKVLIKSSYLHNSKPVIQSIIDRDEFLDELRAIDLGEWKSRYNNHEENSNSFNGTDWYLIIHYNNGTKSKKIRGFNAYPYNFDELLELLDLEDDYLKYTIDEETKNSLINRMIHKIKELPKNTEISTSQLLNLISNKFEYNNGLYIIDEVQLTFSDMMSLNTELLMVAKDNDILIDNTIHDGEILGLLFNIGFLIKDY